MQVPYVEHVLANGLRVLLHEDHDSPLVTVHLAYHVGSAREDPERTGFAHLFEHMMFEGSANVASGEHFKRVQEAGGSLNGNTNGDRTVYFETLPSNTLELGLWLESDRMGTLADALTQETFDNQRDVVKEERRQSYENRPYGLAREVLCRQLYPPGHPYSWTTIGSMAHLEAASLEDARAFFRRYYGPNNASLAIAGDFEPEAALALVERHFGPIPRGPEVKPLAPWPVRLDAPRRVLMEDRVRVPQLSLIWPTVPASDPDADALYMLVRLLSENRGSILDEALSMHEELAAVVSAGVLSQELAGYFQILVRPHEGVSLERLEARIQELLRQLDRDGVDPRHLERVRSSYRAESLRKLELASTRARWLAEDDAVHGDPAFQERAVARRLAVTGEDLVQVLRTYLLERPAFALSVVPAGARELALPGSTAEDEAPAPEPLPGHERPRLSPPPKFTAPEVQHATCDNGLRLWCSPSERLPLSRIQLALRAGHAFETPEQIGLASLVASLAGQGTERLDAAALERELDELGATWQAWCDEDELVFRANVLDEHLDGMFALIAEAVLTPRFVRADLERFRAERLVSLRTRRDDARGRAADAWPGVVFGTSARRGLPPHGTPESVARLDLDAVRAHWSRGVQPSTARLLYVGRLGPDEVRERAGRLAHEWRDDGQALPSPEPQSDPSVERVHLVHLPGAPQTELCVGHEGIAATDPDHFRFTVLNFLLGGNFSSRLNLNLREDKGFTYGARSSTGGGLVARPFTCSAAVRTQASAPAVREVLNELERIQEGVSDEELAFARDAIPRSQALQYESGWARVDFLDKVSKYGWSERYPEERRAELEELQPDDLREQARRHVRAGEARVLVVGDADELTGPLEELGLGAPVRHGDER